MEIEVLASGSSANCYVLRKGGETLLLECGERITTTLPKLKYKLPDAILVTHEHGDHAKSAKNFLERGVPMYMTAGTAEALSLKRHNLNIIQAGSEFKIGSFTVKALAVKHDAAEPVNYIVDELIFITDTGEVPAIEGKSFSQILIETNYSEAALLNADIDEWQRRRILENHLSVDQAIKFLKGNPAAEVYLIHISKRHGDGVEFKSLVEETTDCKIEYPRIRKSPVEAPETSTSNV